MYDATNLQWNYKRIISGNTVELLNNGHTWDPTFCPVYREVVFFLEVILYKVCIQRYF